MNNFFKITLITVAFFLLAWLLPDFYHFATAKKTHYPFVHYSSILNDFLLQEHMNEKKITYKDRKGNSYNDREADSLMPTFFYRQLMTDNRLPDTLHGTAINPQILKRTGFFFRNSPRDVNSRKIELYPLLESRPKRVDLSMPDDVCRFTAKEIQFIQMDSNTINKEKSARFQKVFEQKGVCLPIRTIGGNPTALKEYDEGYFFTDSKNQLYHLKQIQSRPFLRKIEIDTAVCIKHIFVTEFASRKTFAFITDADYNFYVLTAPDYKLVKTRVAAFDPEKEAIFIMGNMFDWNVQISGKDNITNYALKVSDYSLIDTLTTPIVTTEAQKTANYLFPFELKFTSSLNNYFSPELLNFSKQVIWANALLTILFMLIYYRKTKKTPLIISAAAVLIGGLFAFVPLCIFRY